MPRQSPEPRRVLLLRASGPAVQWIQSSFSNCVHSTPFGVIARPAPPLRARARPGRAPGVCVTRSAPISAPQLSSKKAVCSLPPCLSAAAHPCSCRGGAVALLSSGGRWGGRLPLSFPSWTWSLSLSKERETGRRPFRPAPSQRPSSHDFANTLFFRPPSCPPPPPPPPPPPLTPLSVDHGVQRFRDNSDDWKGLCRHRVRPPPRR